MSKVSINAEGGYIWTCPIINCKNPNGGPRESIAAIAIQASMHDLSHQHELAVRTFRMLGIDTTDEQRTIEQAMADADQALITLGLVNPDEQTREEF